MTKTLEEKDEMKLRDENATERGDAQALFYY